MPLFDSIPSILSLEIPSFTAAQLPLYLGLSQANGLLKGFSLLTAPIASARSWSPLALSATYAAALASQASGLTFGGAAAARGGDQAATAERVAGALSALGWTATGISASLPRDSVLSLPLFSLGYTTAAAGAGATEAVSLANLVTQAPKASRAKSIAAYNTTAALAPAFVAALIKAAPSPEIALKRLSLLLAVGVPALLSATAALKTSVHEQEQSPETSGGKSPSKSDSSSNTSSSASTNPQSMWTDITSSLPVQQLTSFLIVTFVTRTVLTGFSSPILTSSGLSQGTATSLAASSAALTAPLRAASSALLASTPSPGRAYAAILLAQSLAAASLASKLHPALSGAGYSLAAMASAAASPLRHTALLSAVRGSPSRYAAALAGQNAILGFGALIPILVGLARRASGSFRPVLWSLVAANSAAVAAALSFASRMSEPPLRARL